MAKLLFKETQQANLGCKWIIFIALYVLMFWALYEQLIAKDLKGMLAIIFSVAAIVIFNITIVLMKLETEIDETKIAFKFRPYHKKQIVIDFKEISKLYIRNYKPMKEFGGYGIQRSIRNGRCYNVSGRIGLQLLLQNGKKVLIGTQKPKELEQVIDKLKSQIK